MQTSDQDFLQLLSDKEGYSSIPVFIDEFLDNNLFLGKIFGGVWENGPYIGQTKMYSYWREILRDIYPNPFCSPYTSIVIYGACGAGKSTIGIVGFLYDLYRWSLLKDPTQKYNLTEPLEYYIGFITGLLKKTNLIVTQLKDIILSMSCFKGSSFPENKLLSNITILQDFSSEQLYGTTTLSNLVETLYLDAEEKFKQGLKKHEEVSRRIISRFEQPYTGVPFRTWLVHNGKSSTAMKSYVEGITSPKVKIISCSLWDVLKERNSYSGETFNVYYGDVFESPKILDQNLIKVPIEYRKEFEKDLIGSLRDIAGILI
jgi:hypothetical protein